MAETNIEWADRTWNPIVGCSIHSPGCRNCYAMPMAARLERMGGADHYAGTTKPTKAGPVWTGKIVRAPESIWVSPLRRRKPTVYFVNSMSDLFHEDVPDEWIDSVFAIMALCPQHTFKILTKRAARMRAYFSAGRERLHTRWLLAGRSLLGCYAGGIIPDAWPLPNVELGVSAEDQRRADERVPDLLATPAAVRFVSAEPLLNGIDFTAIGKAGGETWIDALTGQSAWYDDGWHHDGVCAKLDQIIVGGESGHDARPLWVPDVRAIVKQCQASGTAIFVKQLGANVRDRNDAGFEGIEPHEWPGIDPATIEQDLDGTRDGYQGAPVRIRLASKKGGDPDEWPEDLRIRQSPAVPAADSGRLAL